MRRGRGCPGPDTAGPSRLQWPHRRAQLSPSAKMGAPGEGRGGNRAGKGPKAAEAEEEEAQEGAAAEAARGRRRRRRAAGAAGPEQGFPRYRWLDVEKAFKDGWMLLLQFFPKFFLLSEASTSEV